MAIDFRIRPLNNYRGNLNRTSLGPIPSLQALSSSTNPTPANNNTPAAPVAQTTSTTPTPQANTTSTSAPTNAQTATPATPSSTTQQQAPTAPAAPSIDELRTKFLNEASQGFGVNYGRSLIGDNTLDDTINSILNEQRGSAQQYLDRGKARGIYNDVGYGAGLNKLNTSAEAGKSQLASLGGDVLNKYRTQADSVRDKAFSSISGLLPGQQFSLDPYFAEGNAVKASAEQRAGGDLRNALGGANFFDFSGLTNAAGMAQGAQNLRDADVATALAERKRRAQQDRGLGSQGVF